MVCLGLIKITAKSIEKKTGVFGGGVTRYVAPAWWDDTAGCVCVFLRINVRLLVATRGAYLVFVPAERS